METPPLSHIEEAMKENRLREISIKMSGQMWEASVLDGDGAIDTSFGAIPAAMGATPILALYALDQRLGFGEKHER